jgi:hypothetical protein
VIVCDTGPLVAAADRDDDRNRDCTDLFTALHLARRPILVPGPVVAEVGYLLGRAGGPRVESAFLRSIVAHTLAVVDQPQIADKSGAAYVGRGKDGIGDVDEFGTSPKSRLSTIDTSGPFAPDTSTPSRCCP